MQCFKTRTSGNRQREKKQLSRPPWRDKFSSLNNATGWKVWHLIRNSRHTLQRMAWMTNWDHAGTLHLVNLTENVEGSKPLNLTWCIASILQLIYLSEILLYHHQRDVRINGAQDIVIKSETSLDWQRLLISTDPWRAHVLLVFVVHQSQTPPDLMKTHTRGILTMKKEIWWLFFPPPSTNCLSLSLLSANSILHKKLVLKRC